MSAVNRAHSKFQSPVPDRERPGPNVQRKMPLFSPRLRGRQVENDLGTPDLKMVLKTQYERWWNIYIDHFKSKWHFLRYAGRYIRRPPIAQHRFVKITDREVQFWRKDLREKR